MTNSSVKQTSGNPEVILVVDDDPEIAGFFTALLEVAGYESIQADCGSKAVSIAASGKADLILMDVIMPEMDGVTAAGLIKAGVCSDDFLPIVLVTAYHNEKIKIHGLEWADAYLAKPVSNDELLAVVRSLLKTRTLTRELARTKDTYKRFYENLPNMYLTVGGADGVIVSSNRSFLDIFHASREEVEGKNICSFLLPEDITAFPLFLHSVISTDPVPQQGVFGFLVPVPGSKHAIRKFSIRAAAVPECDGNEGKLAALLMDDVTDKLNLEEEQKLARKQLYRSAHYASIGTLASGVAHELNNPLTAVLGFSSALLGRAKNNEDLDKNELFSYLQIINSEALRCRDIVEHLHRFARDSGEAHITRVPLAECIRSALRLVAMKATRAEITIENKLQDDIWVMADSNRLEQVFINLVTNCIDFCKPGDTVTIAMESPKKAAKHVKVTVCDNGPGMTPEVLAKAFDPFFTTKEVGKGIGMGLALCYKIMDELDGRIDIASELEKGTSVTLEIPYAIQKPVAPPEGGL